MSARGEGQGEGPKPSLDCEEPSPGLDRALIHPRQQDQLAPCSNACASGGDVREWIGVIAQRDRLGLSTPESFAQAWSTIVAHNPFPATMGRICPHPCEAACNRADKDGPVAINALERFLGDWALEQGLGLPVESSESKPESIAVIGAGPAGLSFAYQLARRGYSVSVYERAEEPGGMLRYGVPEYRLPKRILGAEIGRILDLGVELHLGTAVGQDVTIDRLREDHDVIFLGIGAGQARSPGLAGEDVPQVWSGIEYLSRFNRGEPLEPGRRVVVVGGGNTAIDAARTARRQGAEVLIAYRRGRSDMPAIAEEIEDALEEGVIIEPFIRPDRLVIEAGRLRAVTFQRMRPGPPDASGRRSPMPVPDSAFDIDADTVILAVSQAPDWRHLDAVAPESTWLTPDTVGHLGEGLWAAGDALGLGIAGLAIGQGRQAAEALDRQLRGCSDTRPDTRAQVDPMAIDRAYYPDRERPPPSRSPVDERLTDPSLEVTGTLDEPAFLEQVSRCFSCGACMGCEQCFMYCPAGGFTRLDTVGQGTYFALDLTRCEGCGKCIDLCPAAYLMPVEAPPEG